MLEKKYQKCIRFLKKSIQLGPRKTIYIAKNRLQSTLHDIKYRLTAKNKLLNHTWSDIQRTHSITYNFDNFKKQFDQKKLNSFIKFIALQKYDSAMIINEADQLANQCFDLLGSEKQCFTEIPWNCDFRLSKQQSEADHCFDTQKYYKDFIINQGLDDRLSKDIKIPWELSRFQHLLVLGCAFQQSDDKQYSDAFMHQINDWIAKNPLLLGPNWVCPMDVAIRALNWVWGFYLFRYTPNINEQFWEQFTCSLYDHLWYLEHNWEIYDTRTSNHYLSDLIGYYYLCLFFIDLPGMQAKADWCHQELLKECDKQIFDEGTSYEGSTAYHRLVTEIFYHVYIIAPEFNHQLPAAFVQKLRKMFTFINSCTIANDNALIQIGDNDSGKILNGLSPAIVKRMKFFSDELIIHYPKFGLSIIKTDRWHISLRHHAYQHVQPSGHFHNDIGSVTLAYNGLQILVDPGSYVYTPSQYWRNYFRSFKQHNTFGIADLEPVPLDGQLFKLSLPEHESKKPVTQDNCLLSAEHDLYMKQQLRAHRKIQLHDDTNEFVITDQWQSVVQQTINTEWNFVFHPDIALEKSENHIVIHKNNINIGTLISAVPFEIQQSWYSPSYGIKVECFKLHGTLLIGHQITIDHRLQFFA